MLIPRHELPRRLLEDVAKVEVSTQGAKIIKHADPTFIFIEDKQISQSSSPGLHMMKINSQRHVCEFVHLPICLI